MSPRPATPAGTSPRSPSNPQPPSSPEAAARRLVPTGAMRPAGPAAMPARDRGPVRASDRPLLPGVRHERRRALQGRTAGRGRRRPGPGGQGQPGRTRRSGSSCSSCLPSPATSTGPAARSTPSSTTDNDLERAAMSYRKLLDSEQPRRDVFATGRGPRLLRRARPSTCGCRLEAVERLRERRGRPRPPPCSPAPTRPLPPVRGQLNGKPFETLRDADDLFGGVLEVMAQGRYFWAGLEQVRLGGHEPAAVPPRPPLHPRPPGAGRPRRARSSCPPSTRGRTSTPTTRSGSAG